MIRNSMNQIKNIFHALGPNMYQKREAPGSIQNGIL